MLSSISANTAAAIFMMNMCLLGGQVSSLWVGSSQGLPRPYELQAHEYNVFQKIGKGAPNTLSGCPGQPTPRKLIGYTVYRIANTSHHPPRLTRRPSLPSWQAARTICVETCQASKLQHAEIVLRANGCPLQDVNRTYKSRPAKKCTKGGEGKKEKETPCTTHQIKKSY